MKHITPSIIIPTLLLVGCAPKPVVQATVIPATKAPASTPTEVPASASETPTPNPNAWTLIWSDEFDQPNGSAPDATKWNHQTGVAGWGNGELQHYTDKIENASIQDGMLVIKANKEYMLGHDYTSARLTTQFKADWTYGRFEVRAKLPNTQGIWPAFWLFPTRAVYGSGPAGGEIDIMEMIGKEPYRSYATLHYGNPPTRSSGYYDLPAGKTYADDFHTFAVEWEPTEIRWYVDDMLFHSVDKWFTSAKNNAPYPAPYDQNFYLIVNIAVGGTWPGSPDETSVFPQMMYMDYVRVYQHPK